MPNPTPTQSAAALVRAWINPECGRRIALEPGSAPAILAALLDTIAAHREAVGSLLDALERKHGDPAPERYSPDEAYGYECGFGDAIEMVRAALALTDPSAEARRG